MNELQSCSYWVICGNAAVKKMIFHCVQCRRLRGKLVEQKMANLPYCRVAEAPPFTFCGVDMFGPFIIKQRRSQVKRYGATFTCMSCRAVHIEITHFLDTDSFILALRRLIARRENIQTIFSDNGSNFINSEDELRRTFEEMDKEKLQSFMQASGSDWITWKRNPPYASHMGGVWELQIHSVRSILSSLMQTHGSSLDEESLATLMTETEGILNSRPLTTDSICDPTRSLPLSSSNLLTMKSKIISPPPGDFLRPDLYSRRRWRWVQHILNEFWCRWKKEFLQSLQERKKLANNKTNLKAGDIVILQVANTIRDDWPMCRVMETYCDEKGFVRNVTLKIGSVDQVGRNNIVDRPVSKVVLLLEGEEVDENVLQSPPMEPRIKCNVISRYHVS